MIDPRDRLTEGFTRARLGLEARRSVRPTFLFVASFAIAVAAVAWFLSNLTATFGHKTSEVRFAVTSNYGVFPGVDEVRFRGVTAGTITSVERQGHRLILVARIRDDRGDVFRDARAQIRPITPLNDVYLDIVDPGTPEAGRPDPAVPLDEAQTETSVTVPDVLDIFQADERRSFRVLLDQLGNGAADGGARLRRAFVALAPFLRQAGALTEQIADREKSTKRLVHNTAVLTRELGQRERDLRRLVTTGAAAVGALGQSSADLDSTLVELAPTATELQRSLASVRAIVDDLDGGLRGLYPVAERASGALRTLRSLDRTLRPAVAELRPAVRALTPWVPRLDDVALRLRPIARAVRAETSTISRLSQRLVDCEPGIIGFFQWDTSLAKFGDRNAPIPRGNLAFGVPAIGLTDEPLREPETGCTPGPVVRGVPTPEDLK